MSSSQSLNHVLIVSQENRTMHIPISLHGLKKTVDTLALIDFRATGNFINPPLLPKGIFKLRSLPTSIIAFNVDGTPNTKGPSTGPQTFLSTLVLSLTRLNSWLFVSLILKSSSACPGSRSGIPSSTGLTSPLTYLLGSRGLFVSILPKEKTLPRLPYPRNSPSPNNPKTYLSLSFVLTSLMYSLNPLTINFLPIDPLTIPLILRKIFFQRLPRFISSTPKNTKRVKHSLKNT